MAVIRPRDLLPNSLLQRLGGTPDASGSAPGGASEVAGTVARDIAKLADVGYLKVALPPEFGGLGCTLRQAACGQRRLARRVPLTAMAVSAHLYWTGAAADAYRAGDNSVRWILLEAARGALFAAGHGTPGNDLHFASPQSRCELVGMSVYRFRNTSVLSSLTPTWDWVAVHAVTAPRPDAVLAFAGRGSRCTPAFRVVRVQPTGSPADVFTTSAIAWGHSLNASVEYSAARRAFNHAVEAASQQPTPDGTHPLDRWPVAEASLRLDAMKAKIAEITHPWPLVPGQEPDLGGQRLISIFTMRHEVAEGARQVLGLTTQIASAPAIAAL
jgi:alkylation response protein AidB-like acyl-CoA dehydrogenase